jgi:hypothetical protein
MDQSFSTFSHYPTQNATHLVPCCWVNRDLAEEMMSKSLTS